MQLCRQKKKNLKNICCNPSTQNVRFADNHRKLNLKVKQLNSLTDELGKQFLFKDRDGSIA